MKEQIFKVGDKVNDPQFGEGEVVQILDEYHLFPLCVKFNNIEIEITYTLSGAYTHLSEPVLTTNTMNKQEVIQSTSDPVLFARVFSEYINQDIFDLCFAINFYKRNQGFFQSHMNIELIEHLEDLGFNGKNEGDWVIMSMNNVTFNFSL